MIAGRPALFSLHCCAFRWRVFPGPRRAALRFPPPLCSPRRHLGSGIPHSSSSTSRDESRDLVYPTASPDVARLREAISQHRIVDIWNIYMGFSQSDRILELTAQDHRHVARTFRYEFVSRLQHTTDEPFSMWVDRKEYVYKVMQRCAFAMNINDYNDLLALATRTRPFTRVADIWEEIRERVRLERGTFTYEKQQARIFSTLLKGPTDDDEVRPWPRSRFPYTLPTRPPFKLNALTYAIAMAGFARAGLHEMVQEIYHEFMQQGYPMNSAAVCALLISYTELGHVHAAESIYRHIVKSSATPKDYAEGKARKDITNQGLLSPKIFSRMAHLYGFNGRLAEMVGVAEDVQACGFDLDVRTFDHMIESYQRANDLQSALELFRKMQRPPYEYQPTHRTFKHMIRLAVSTRQHSLAVELVRDYNERFGLPMYSWVAQLRDRMPDSPMKRDIEALLHQITESRHTKNGGMQS